MPPITQVWQPYFDNAPPSWWVCLMRAIRAHSAAEFAAARSHYQESIAFGPSMLALRGLAMISATEGDPAPRPRGIGPQWRSIRHCRPLLVEAVDALLAADRSATALELIDAAPPEVAAHGRVVLQRIRALLAVGDRAAAARLLQQASTSPTYGRASRLKRSGVWLARASPCPPAMTIGCTQRRRIPSGSPPHQPKR